MQQSASHRGWAYAGMILGILSLFIGGMSMVPEFFAARIFDKTYLTVGVLLGIAVIVIPVIFTALHNVANRGDQADV